MQLSSAKPESAFDKTAAPGGRLLWGDTLKNRTPAKPLINAASNGLESCYFRRNVGSERALGNFAFRPSLEVYMMHFTSNDSQANVVGVSARSNCACRRGARYPGGRVGSIVLWRAYTARHPIGSHRVCPPIARRGPPRPPSS